jgi:Na+-translocating ferredoxin:NAD+ oxidoreductase subunit B
VNAQLAERIDATLPQTQCRRCGFEGCRPYAEAIAKGTAEINRCPPGGAATIARLAELVGRAALPLNPDCGVEAPARVAFIDESRCIGCARCLPPCPVDAIIGAPRHTHTVIAAACTGCELCIAPCPVDCITLREAGTSASGPAENRMRYEARNARTARRTAERATLLAERKRTVGTLGTTS